MNRIRDSDALATLLAIVIVTFIGVGGAACLTVAIAPQTCAMRWDGSGFETRWGFGSGCQVQVGGRWMPEKAVRTTGGDE